MFSEMMVKVKVNLNMMMMMTMIGMILSETQSENGVWVSPRRCHGHAALCDADLNLNPSPPHSDVHHIQYEETYLYHDDDDQGASQLGKCKRNFNISFLEDNNNNINSNNKIDRTMLQCCQG